MAESRNWQNAGDWVRVGNLLCDGELIVAGLGAVGPVTVSALNVSNTASDIAQAIVQFTARNGFWQEGTDNSNVTPARDLVLAAKGNAFAFEDGATVLGSPTLASAVEGRFASSMVGAALTGDGIPLGTTVAAVVDAQHLTMSLPATATAGGVRVSVAIGGVTDFVYAKHRGASAPVLGIGDTPPAEPFLYRLSVAPDPAELAMGGLGVFVSAGETGKAIDVHDGGTDLFWVSPNGHVDALGGVTFDSSIATVGDIKAGANLRFDQAGDVYIYAADALSGAGNQSLNVFAGGTGVIRFNSNAGGVAHAGTGGLELWAGNNGGAAVWTVNSAGLTSSPGGVATKVKAGAPSDADFPAAPPLGTIVVDTTNNKIWARVGANVWKGVVIV